MSIKQNAKWLPVVVEIGDLHQLSIQIIKRDITIVTTRMARIRSLGLIIISNLRIDHILIRSGEIYHTNRRRRCSILGRLVGVKQAQLLEKWYHLLFLKLLVHHPRMIGMMLQISLVEKLIGNDMTVGALR